MACSQIPILVIQLDLEIDTAPSSNFRLKLNEVSNDIGCLYPTLIPPFCIRVSPINKQHVNTAVYRQHPHVSIVLVNNKPQK